LPQASLQSLADFLRRNYQEMENAMTDYQAIVIGSGAGGLSAALTLSRSGSSVLLLEAMPSFGGYLNPFQRKS
jgi:heterodisulfide reductase subunit A-like polyferredoxin